MSIESRTHQYGLIFDHWQIKELLGTGSGGKTAVYRLEHTDGSGVCSALKVISLIEDRGNISKLDDYRRTEYIQARKKCWDYAKQEVLLMNSLRGKTNVAGYLDHKYVDWSDEKSFGRDMLILMELLHDLRSDIQNTRFFSEDDIIKIGRDIASALVLCHSKRIIHRDIKPENIFYNDDGDYKLGDFGISKIMSATPRAAVTTDIGTPEYAAPEQTSGKYDERVDIYGLGLVLYELANNNRLPFINSSYVSADEMESALHKRLHGVDLPPPCNASAELASVILKACASDVSKRYQTAAELLQALTDLPCSQVTPGVSAAKAGVASNANRTVYNTEKAKPHDTSFVTVDAWKKKEDNATDATMGRKDMPHKRKKTFIPLLICAAALLVGFMGAMLGIFAQSEDQSDLPNGTANTTHVNQLPDNTVKPVTLQGLSIHSTPNKTNYVVGEKINTAGLEVVAKYSDGSSQIISSGLSVTPTVLDTAGKQKVTVTYKGNHTNFDVFVDEVVTGPVREIKWKEINADYTYDSANELTGFLLQCMFTCDPHDESGFIAENSFGGERGHQPFYVDVYEDKYMYFSFWIPNDSSLEGWHTVTLYHDGTSEAIKFYLDFIGDYSHIIGTAKSAEGLGWKVTEWKPVS